jgi:transcriptional regulator with XRE-family HTH domain
LAHTGKSRNQVARALGISGQAVAQWFRDEKPTVPTHANLAAFCDELGITLSEFWGPLPEGQPKKSRKRKAA